MNNPEAIRYVNEVVRPLAERFRDLMHDCRDARTAWQNGIGATISADLQAAIEDGRDLEGVSRLTANDVVLFMSQVEGLDDRFAGVGVAGVIAKPCVRAMRG